ncbi:ExbD/TolR family protein [Chlorobium phaeobacteroides]|jgi:biopolymer transport protein ExbD|uniref:Outer membrane transport energization protein ExbD n=1 Tax=Chlorobium phaeobacteroides (strain DSM 266 / SMG 266 / 2430) TaxID=290317 RepID=A1BE34_CHLPD|nr:biopolymer transporter ExbD [Chlorobium phaeobacteroides]ABL64661.1 outer membrane transport energization protein ExbD [Chlorobium phaeobacteroides DSM 266]MBV5326283.1 biopolymer transporter ExbD [Chlorobium sp.]
MGMVDSPNERRAKKGRKRIRKRIGFHLDMTPMVDVAFLLLTFFMLTTTFAKSNTMEISMPPEMEEVKIAEANVMTLRISGEGMAYCSLGNEAPRRLSLYESGDASRFALSAELRQILKQQTTANKKLVIVLKISEKAKYKYLVDVIDELNLMKIDRFSLDDFTDQDELEIKRAV